MASNMGTLREQFWANHIEVQPLILYSYNFFVYSFCLSLLEFSIMGMIWSLDF